MDRFNTTRLVGSFVAAFALVAVLAAVAGAASGGTTDPSPTPVTTPAPVASPSPTPTPAPVSPPPATEVPGGFVVDLDIADASAVSVVIDDPTGVIVGAASGRGSDGMTVRWGEIQVENVDADTLRFTWSGYPQDEVITMSFGGTDDGYLVTVTQRLPYPNTDAMGADRVLIVDVAEAVRAEDVSARFIPGA